MSNNRKVFRDQIKEDRGEYYAIYCPADARMSFATIQVVFPDNGFDAHAVADVMERELEEWLRRYPVPAMVSAFNAKEDVISLSDEFDRSHLTGYIDPLTGQIVRKWGSFEESELPSAHLDSGYLEHVYQDIPFRLQEEVRQKAQHEARITGRVIRLFVFFVVVIPVLIEIISLGVDWLGYILSAISISVGVYKVAKAMGWLKLSQREKEKAEKDLKMQHYYWHCERNPEAFNRLKIENFEREAIERTRKEADELRKDQK
jgi:hypothetical protein